MKISKEKLAEMKARDQQFEDSIMLLTTKEMVDRFKAYDSIIADKIKVKLSGSLANKINIVGTTIDDINFPTMNHVISEYEVYNKKHSKHKDILVSDYIYHYELIRLIDNIRKNVGIIHQLRSILILKQSKSLIDSLYDNKDVELWTIGIDDDSVTIKEKATSIARDAIYVVYYAFIYCAYNLQDYQLVIKNTKPLIDLLAYITSVRNKIIPENIVEIPTIDTYLNISIPNSIMRAKVSENYEQYASPNRSQKI